LGEKGRHGSILPSSLWAIPQAWIALARAAFAHCGNPFQTRFSEYHNAKSIIKKRIIVNQLLNSSHRRFAFRAAETREFPIFLLVFRGGKG
jgi:hypothetical protein